MQYTICALPCPFNQVSLMSPSIVCTPPIGQKMSYKKNFHPSTGFTYLDSIKKIKIIGAVLDLPPNQYSQYCHIDFSFNFLIKW